MFFLKQETTLSAEIVWPLQIRRTAPVPDPEGGLGLALCGDLSTHPAIIQRLPPSWARKKTTQPGASGHQVFVLFASSLSAAARMCAMPLMGINGYSTCYRSLGKKEAA